MAEESKIMPTVSNPFVYFMDEKDNVIVGYPLHHSRQLPVVGDEIWIKTGIFRVTERLFRYNDEGIFSVCITVV